MKKVGVLIGRFQPVTIPHSSIIKQSLKKYDKLIVCIGSSEASPSLRNPWTKQERFDMLCLVFGTAKNWLVCELPDSNYNFNEWIKSVHAKIDNAIGNIDEEIEISLIGSYKDSGSYWLNSFPQWKLDNVDIQKGASGSQIRKTLFGVAPELGWETEVLEPIKEYIFDWMKKNPVRLKNLCEEQLFINKYREQWATAPYKPTFVTTDACVLCKGHVLIIKRKRNPGKNLYALPGGFLNTTEYIQDGCLRELKEETKIDVAKPILENSIKKVKVIDNPYRDERGRIITHAHLIVLNLSDLPKVKEDDDAKEVLWLPLGSVDKYQSQFYSDHYAIIQNLIAGI